MIHPMSYVIPYASHNICQTTRKITQKISLFYIKILNVKRKTNLALSVKLFYGTGNITLPTCMMT